MRIWTVHLRDDAPPVLVREGFSLGAAVFGPIWLALHRAWLPAALVLAVWVAMGGLTSDGVRLLLDAGLVLLQGLSGYDLRRWSLERRGFTLAEVVTAHNAEAAFTRLLDRRRDLGERLLRAGVA
jgi:Protein of unknown function (DUF2628)